MKAPEPIEARHELGGFDCGEPKLNDWLRTYALANHGAGFSKTYVVHESNRVVGYYALAAGFVLRGEAPERIVQGGGKEIPVAILARLAVDLPQQGAGMGSQLLRDALIRIVQAGDIIGVRAVLVHMKNDELRRFYGQYEFEPSPVDDKQMFLLMKDLRKALVS